MNNIYNGIDVSRWQGTINWTAVKAAGMQFAMIRLGYCTYTGSMVKDTQFDANMKGAAAAGLDVGVYMYSYATTPAAAALAAATTLEMIKGYQLTYPVAFDIEDTVNVALTPAQNTAITKAYLSAIQAGGYLPMLYSYKSFAESELIMSQLGDYDFWLAHVSSHTSYTGPYTIWQYSWTGKVNGINGDVDLNYCYKDYPTYIRENGLNGFAPAENGGSSGGDDGDITGDIDNGDSEDDDEITGDIDNGDSEDDDDIIGDIDNGDSEDDGEITGDIDNGDTEDDGEIIGDIDNGNSGDTSDIIGDIDDSDSQDDGDIIGDIDNGTESVSPAPSEPAVISHVVEKNETLTLIAKRYGISLQTLIQANPQVTNPNLILVGDIIRIPPVAGSVL